MSHKFAHVVGVAALSGALVTSGAALSSPAGAAPATASAGVVTVAPAAGTAAVTTGADWLVGELDEADGLVHNQWGINHGLSIDVALALAAVGRDADAQGIATAFTAEVANYTVPFGSVSAGSTAKTAVLAQVTGQDPTDFANTDLIAQLEERIDVDGPLAGRIQDEDPDYDIANVFGQAYAVAALAEAESPLAGHTADFLLEQQCAEGFFRLSFSAKDAADQSCDADAAASPHPDATALAVIELRPLAADNPEVEAAVGRAVAWLQAAQNADGSLNGDQWTSAPNANSTGLAGWAFDLTGADDAAAEAAVWLRTIQVSEQSDCGDLSADVGAIAYDPDTFDAACEAAVAIADNQRQQWQIAGAQSLPALRALTATPEPEPVVNSEAVEPTADWLSGQLTNGLVHNDQFGFDDIGLTLDIGFGFAAVGRVSDAQEITAAVAPQIDGYTSLAPSIYASATAKAANFAQTMGQDPTDFGGIDLIGRLEGRVAANGPITGRLEDKENPAFPGDYANVIGQAYAASVLTTAGSAQAESVTDFLLDQQCDAGYFRLNFTPDKTRADQTCQAGVAAGESPADTDVTALTVLQLQDVADGDAAVQAAVDQAVLWLKENQRDDGSFGGGEFTKTPNTNSTGLAAAALEEVGDTDAASAAATWIRDHQVAEIAGCGLPLPRDNGAVAYDAAALETARGTGIEMSTSDQWRRASAQALPALAHAPEDSVSASPTLAACGRTKYVKARSRQTLRVAGVPTGATLRINGRGIDKTVVGTGRLMKVKVRLAKRSGKRAIVVRRGDDSARITFRALGAKKLKIRPVKRVTKRGKKAKVVVRGLAASETVRVRYKGKLVRKGRATKSGVYRTRFRVGHKKGNFKLVVRGQFAHRKGVARQRVK